MDFNDLEAWAEMGILGLDVQVYDLRQVTEFVIEIADAAQAADAPLFHAGLVPSEKCVLLLQHSDTTDGFGALYLEKIGRDRIKCSALSLHSHNEILLKMAESAGTLANMIAVGNVPSHMQPALDYLDQNDWLNPDLPQNQLYDEPICEIGKPAKRGLNELGSGLVFMASAACEFMAMPIAARAPGNLPRPVRRRLERTGKKVRITNVNLTRSVAAGMARKASEADASAGRALHFVSGHWRISPTSIHAQPVHGNMKIWIDGFWRGDPAHGVVLHRYLARKKAA
jgi:hypothetical protein